MHDRAPAIATLAALASDRSRGPAHPRSASPAKRSWTEEAAASGDPTVASLEELLAALEGGTSAVAFASAEAMLHTLGRVLLRPGDDMVAARELPTTAMPALAHSFPGFGWRVAWASLDDRASFEDAIGPRTKAILAPAVGADGSIADLAMLAELARRAGVPLIVDNTLATPALSKPIDHGAHAVIHSSAATIAGRGSLAALIDGGAFDWQREARHAALSEPQAPFGNAVLAQMFGNFALAAACRLVGARAFAASPSAEEAGRLVDGVGTLGLRLERQRATAQRVAEWLDARAEIAWVRYAGLPGNRYHNLAKRYAGGSGAPLLSFQPRDASEGLVSALSVFLPTEALAGGTRSQIESVTTGSGTPFFRLWIGIEDEADLIADLEDALSGAA